MAWYYFFSEKSMLILKNMVVRSCGPQPSCLTSSLAFSKTVLHWFVSVHWTQLYLTLNIIISRKTYILFTKTVIVPSRNSRWIDFPGGLILRKRARLRGKLSWKKTKFSVLWGETCWRLHNVKSRNWICENLTSWTLIEDHWLLNWYFFKSYSCVSFQKKMNIVRFY
jgi:hypothetical protein